MKKTAAIMVALGIDKPDIMKNIERVAARFERLNDIPVTMITEVNVADFELVAPHFARFYAWKLLPKDIERIIYFDYDMLPFHALPKQFPDVDFAAVPENSRLADSAKDTIPLLKRVGMYFNSGFFIATRKTEKLFERMTIKQPTFRNGVWILDQTLLNVEVQTAVDMGEITFNPLPNRWCIPFWDLRPGMEPSMVHFLSLTDLIKMRLVGHLCKVIDGLEREITVGGSE